MALDGAWNAYIFREGKTSIHGQELVNQLARELYSFGSSKSNAKRNQVMDCLLRAGELEGALLDSAAAQGSLIANVTDVLAEALVTNRPVPGDELASRVHAVIAPKTVTVTPPEGFAYYSLHPLDFADLIRHVELHSSFIAVIGIRSIGTTLSAVVQAALRIRELHVERTTVRPVGHPYDRRTQFTSAQLRWISTMLSRRADFLVVDEGPGMSGSSFLSVGDALLAAGVPRASISFLCSRDAQPSSLTARNAAQRWPAFRKYCTVPTVHLPKQAHTFIAGGIWRAYVYDDQHQWPASWLQMERLKFLSKAGDRVFKFEGYGRFGRTVYERSIRVAQAGFGPMPLGFEEGFGVYPRLRGRVLKNSDVTPNILQRMADYCAFRVRSMETVLPTNIHLDTMFRFNVKQEFGVELSPASELHVIKPVIADGRMAPHKWIDTDGAIMKVDAAVHGDDHFFPGPTDIAWDLAGAIVEWRLDPASTSYFLDCYCRVSGDDAQGRVSSYLLAYTIFRMAYCKMAAATMQGTEEEARLLTEYTRYRSEGERYLRQPIEPIPSPSIVRNDAGPELQSA